MIGYKRRMEPEVPPPRSPSRFEQLMTEFGPWAIGIYLALFGAVLAVYFVSSLWWRPEGASGLFALFGGAWLAAKATQPFRIAATLALTPFVARAFRRARPPT